ncbi:MAG: glycosyltransferase [Gammaproteobacteria bacterium]
MSNRVLVLVTSSFPIRSDGSEAAGSFVADLAEEMAKFINVRIVAPGYTTMSEQWAERIEVRRYATPLRPLSTLKAWRANDLYWITRVLYGGARTTRAAVTLDVTHVFALWGLPCGEWARRAARARGIGYSVWLLGSDIWSLGRLPILRGMLARVIRRARSAYADGYQLAKDAELIAGVPVHFLPSTRRIDLPDPLPPRDQPPYRLLFLGRWHRNKGIDLLLDALAMQGDDGWRHIEKVEIWGGGPLAPLVRERVAQLRAIGRPIELGGFLNKHEAEAAISRADWVLIPSRIESIPVIFSDAMKLRRPVITTPVGDLPRLVGADGCGILAERVDAMAYRQSLNVMQRTSTWAFAEGISVQATHFDIGKIAANILQTISDQA